MNIRHLQIFKTVCEEQSVTRAAIKLYMTQPAVSHVIKDLEDTLGYPLFDRISRRLYVTCAGEKFLQKVRQLLSLHDEIELEAQHYEKEAPIRIGSSITIANFWLPEILHAFQSKECTPIHVQVDSAFQILDKLKRNEIDLAYLEGVVPQGNYVTHSFAKYRLCIACAPSFLKRHKTWKYLDDIKEQPFLLREKGSAIRDSFDSYIMLAQMQIEPSFTSVNSQALLQAARMSLGITVLPDMLLQKDFEEGTLVELNIKDFKLSNKNFLLYHKDKYLSSAMKKIISLTSELFS